LDDVDDDDVDDDDDPDEADDADSDDVEDEAEAEAEADDVEAEAEDEDEVDEVVADSSSEVFVFKISPRWKWCPQGRLTTSFFSSNSVKHNGHEPLSSFTLGSDCKKFFSTPLFSLRNGAERDEPTINIGN